MRGDLVTALGTTSCTYRSPALVFRDSIHVTDPAFKRPEQGQLPPVENLEAAMTHLLDTDTCIGVIRQRFGMVQRLRQLVQSMG